MGTLERLQNSIFEFLRGINDLRFADIKKDTLRDLNGKAEGLRINIVSPLPKSASKYAAGPTFSEVEIAVEISRDDNVAVRAPSLLTSAEMVSRAFHNWTPPVNCGFGRISLAAQNPWEKSRPDKIKIIFNAQSILQ